MNSENYLKALAYVAGANDSENRRVYVEPKCFASAYSNICLIDIETDIKNFYDQYIFDCESFFAIVKT